MKNLEEIQKKLNQLQAELDVMKEPKLKIREGAWYERRGGGIVGPAEKNQAVNKLYPWSIGSFAYMDDGTYLKNSVAHMDLIREVPAPNAEPEPSLLPIPDGAVYLGKGGTFKRASETFEGWLFASAEQGWVRSNWVVGSNPSHHYAAPIDSEIARINGLGRY